MLWDESVRECTVRVDPSTQAVTSDSVVIAHVRFGPYRPINRVVEKREFPEITRDGRCRRRRNGTQSTTRTRIVWRRADRHSPTERRGDDPITATGLSIPPPEYGSRDRLAAHTTTTDNHRPSTGFRDSAACGFVILPNATRSVGHDGTRPLHTRRHNSQDSYSCGRETDRETGITPREGASATLDASRPLFPTVKPNRWCRRPVALGTCSSPRVGIGGGGAGGERCSGLRRGRILHRRRSHRASVRPGRYRSGRPYRW